jgi:hypothetical protein
MNRGKGLSASLSLLLGHGGFDASHARVWRLIGLGADWHAPVFYRLQLPDRESFFALSPRGAYGVVKLAISHGDFAYALLRAGDPAVLERLLREGGQGPRAPRLFREGQIELLDVRRAAHCTGPQGSGFNWVHRRIKDHDKQLGDEIARHGLLAQESPYAYQSSTSLFWLEPAPGERCHVHYYCNPWHKRERMVDARSLAAPAVQYLLKRFSVRLSAEPLALAQAQAFIEGRFVAIARDLLEGTDPYLSSGRDAKDRRPIDEATILAHTATVRAGQRMGVTLAELSKDNLLGGIVGAVAVSVLTQSALALFFVVKLVKAGVVVKALASVWIYLSRKMVEHGRNSRRQDDSLAVSLCAPRPLHLGPPSLRPLHPALSGAVEAVRLSTLGPDFVPADPYRARAQRDWGASMLFDTETAPYGTLLSVEERHGRAGLLSRQSNGIDIWYDAALRIAYAQRARQPAAGLSLEAPIADLFAQGGERPIAIHQDEALGLRLWRGPRALPRAIAVQLKREWAAQVDECVGPLARQAALNLLSPRTASLRPGTGGPSRRPRCVRSGLPGALLSLWLDLHEAAARPFRDFTPGYGDRARGPGFAPPLASLTAPGDI